MTRKLIDIEAERKKAEKVIDLLRNPAITLPLYKLLRQAALPERNFYKIYPSLISAEEFNTLMRNRVRANYEIKRLPRQKRNQRRQQNEDRAHAALVEEFRVKQPKTVDAWCCCGCGENFSTLPDICPKCNDLHFWQVKIPVQEAA